MLGLSNVKASNSTKPSSTNRWLYIMLVLTLAMTAWVGINGDQVNEDDHEILLVNKPTQDEVVLTTPTRQAIAEIQQNQSIIPWHQLLRNPSSKEYRDVFNVQTWIELKPVQKIKPTPPPPPQAPKAPFIYVGKFENHKQGAQVFLMTGNVLYTVLVGEKVNPQWQLDSEDTNALHFTYIPLNLKQVLSKSTRQASPIAQEIN